MAETPDEPGDADMPLQYDYGWNEETKKAFRIQLYCATAQPEPCIKIYAKDGKPKTHPATAIFADASEYDIPQFTIQDLDNHQSGLPKAKVEAKTSSKQVTEWVGESKDGAEIKVVYKPQSGRVDLVAIVVKEKGKKASQKCNINMLMAGSKEEAVNIMKKIAMKVANGEAEVDDLYNLRDAECQGR
eukprot:5981657-Karenia_brevis.AAC.1